MASVGFFQFSVTLSKRALAVSVWGSPFWANTVLTPKEVARAAPRVNVRNNCFMFT